MKKVMLLGAGKIGTIISDFLANSGDYHVTIADQDKASLDRIDDAPSIKKRHIDVTNKNALVKAMKGHFAILSAMPFNLTRNVAFAAAEAHVHYLDLTEDVETANIVKNLAKKSDRAFIPQCGLAPGFITIIAYELARHFDSLEDVHMRVGALPKYPSNALKYNLTWSTDGLINEYCNPCEAIVEGTLKQVPALEERETFSLDGTAYEAFNTSGGLGTLCETLKDKVHNLNYRTVRYPGHRDIMKMLLHDLRLKERQDLLKQIMEDALPVTLQDVVLVFVNVSGKKDGVFMQETYVNKIYSQKVYGKLRSGIQITTAAGICTVLDLLSTGVLPQRGLIKQEDISFDDFISNRFGHYYAKPGNATTSPKDKDTTRKSEPLNSSNRAA
ncbi:MAG: saccharopine dehydrogenase family protein [Agarilytica sp.]